MRHLKAFSYEHSLMVDVIEQLPCFSFSSSLSHFCHLICESIQSKGNGGGFNVSILGITLFWKVCIQFPWNLYIRVIKYTNHVKQNWSQKVKAKGHLRSVSFNFVSLNLRWRFWTFTIISKVCFKFLEHVHKCQVLRIMWN